MVLQVLREHKLYAKLCKCIFYQKNIHNLGNILLVNRIVVDVEKIHTIRGCLDPKNVTYVR
jgi:hypothetical protein